MVADIHSNIHALRAVFEALDTLGVDDIVCAGDVVGYGAHPDACCADIRRRYVRSVAGNHDRAALTKDISMLNPYAAAAAIWTHDNLDEDSREFLTSLPTRLDIDIGNEVKAAVFHGSDRDPDEYVYEQAVDGTILERCPREFVVFGHTHVPFAVALPSGKVINPGSVGQPRDGDPRASFAILSSEPIRCEIHRVEYDIGEASEAILKAGLPAVLAQRLSIGR
ncbi:MAG: metallophosphoesterase family protein [Methanobacteriota archaeon]|nr:MAG: metallophosphoesterase family protein [Euryarchaeota archaeon]